MTPLLVRLIAGASFAVVLHAAAGGWRSVEAQAGTGTIRGVVISAATGEGIVRATVEASGQRVLTNDNGRFELGGIPSGSTAVRAIAFGHRPATVQATVTSGAATEVRIILEALPVELAPVETEAQRSRERRLFEETPDVGGFSIAGRTMSQLPAVGEADVLRVVQLLPGVLARNDYDAGYNVRGGESDQNLVLLDGIPVYNPFHMGGLFGTFIDDAIERADLSAGGFGASYGGRLSSVLDVDSREEARAGVHGSAGLSLLSSSLMLGGAPGDGRTSWNVAARRTYADLLARQFRDEGFPYHFQDAQLHLMRVLGGGGTISLTGYAGKDVLDGSFASLDDSTNLGGGDLVFDWGNALAGITLNLPVRRLFGDSATIIQRASVSHFGTSLNLGGGGLRFENRVLDLRLSGSLTRSGEKHTPAVGYEVVRHNLSYDIFSEQLTANLFELEQKPTTLAVFAEDLWRVTPSLLARIGVRAEQVSDAGWTGISPRVALKYFLTPDLAVTAAGGRYAQWLHAVRDEDLPVRIFDFWVSADEHIPVSLATHAVLGAESWLSDARFVRVEAFLKEYDRLVEPDPADDPTVRGDEFRDVEGRSYGLDVLVRQLDLGRLSGWLAYTFTMNHRIKDDERYAPAQDRRHNLNLIATYRTAGEYVLSGRFGFGTGTPFTPIEGQLVRRVYDPARQMWDPAGAERQTNVVGGERNSSRYPVYHRLDFAVSRTYVKRRTTITPYLQLVNAYNRRNVWIYSFDYEDNPPTSEAISQFPILPTLGVTVEW
ncbi:MAG TPA: TonB-dependent receptor [Gemmatimonadaceae bacterium]|nr:TonB-dependent receptor [Gemmatimonadaceae bacterium]